MTEEDQIQGSMEQNLDQQLEDNRRQQMLESLGELQEEALQLDSQLKQHEQDVNERLGEIKDAYEATLARAEVEAKPLKEARARVMVKMAENPLCPELMAQFYLAQAAEILGTPKGEVPAAEEE